MRLPWYLALMFLPLLPAPALAQEAAEVVRERVYIGLVADEHEGAGVLVRAVAPASPAHKAGICVGDVLLRVGASPVNSRKDLREVVAEAACGDLLVLELRRGGAQVNAQVVLERRPDTPSLRSQAESSLGADRRIRPLPLPDAIRQEIRRHRRLLREQLASLPDGLVPAMVTEELNAIRNLARDAHATRPGWMLGRAGEISVRFRDEEGSVVLFGANNQVSLELYDIEGKMVGRYELNTEDERHSLPEAVLMRLRRFR